MFLEVRLLLSAGCQQNLPVEKKVIAGWTQTGRQSFGVDSKWFLG